MLCSLKGFYKLKLPKNPRSLVALTETKILFFSFLIQEKLARIPGKTDLTHLSYSFVLCFCVRVIHLQAQNVLGILLD